ncbi:hypothetical protein SS1G_06135 [Sclerotinia sclerotiorum 1980 UF-70]|uniref:Uncharacterized protein n=1 Tax=Sclerotinia sclerotiorum (strain ATCC 18683 / 1980 / Ss-1) TaxID=665079 RepID=A7ELD8_SCLS1|nr:hypothetical protein SS1G_06135 [Sclerotinia sclerotiorum 1980 UF-70]EDO03654.1 hypothetical protein SS1G_06135 [Sclerotinia sclerotiorum 1980 UF-70]
MGPCQSLVRNRNVRALDPSLSFSSGTYIPTSTTDVDLIPWVTVDASGHASTVTPILTTIDGKTTTIDAAPATLTASDTSSTSGTTSRTSTSGEVLPTSTGGGAFEICHNLKGKFAPFCKPDNGSNVYVDETYYVTWDTEYLTGSNNSVFIQANYVNASGGGVQAFQSILTSNSLGFIAWTIDKAWLKGMNSNNITLFITSTQKTAISSIQGPTLMVTTSPAPEPYRQPPSRAPHGASLYIALPTVLAFIVLVIGGTYYCNRKHRTIGMGSVMGRRKGYGTGSRRQRMGLGKKKDRAIMLRNQELMADGQYRDVPSSRAEDPTMHYRDEMSWDNDEHFRDETRWQAGSRL